MNSSEATEVINRTKAWLVETVIGLNLCPFANNVHVKNQIRYEISKATNMDLLLTDLISELKFLSNSDSNVVDTSLLIFPYVLNNFLDYNDFLDTAEAAVSELNLDGVIQIASFHPNYQFGGTSSEDVENYTNRSPYPMLHLLRESSLSKAIAEYPDVAKIPDRNIETLKNLDQIRLNKLKSLL